jgi:hypothetical protein
MNPDAPIITTTTTAAAAAATTTTTQPSVIFKHCFAMFVFIGCSKT